MSLLPLKAAISDVYPAPDNNTARAGFAALWDALNEATEKPELNLASAATIDLGGQASTKLRITGTTGPITSFGTTYRGPIFGRFQSPLVLTHNATTLILPGGANLTTSAGGTFIAVPKATTSGTHDGWIVVFASDYFAKAGVNTNITELQGLTTPLSKAQGGTGTTGSIPFFDGFGSAVAPTTWTSATAARKYIFINSAGATTQTLPLASTMSSGESIAFFNYGAGQATIARQGTTDAFVGANAGVTSFVLNQGESAIGTSDAGGTWFWMVHKAGKTIGQIVTSATGAVATGILTIPYDDTIPQNNEGDQYLSRAITPQNASSTLVIDVVIVLSSSVANDMIVALFQDATLSALTAVEETIPTASGSVVIKFTYIMTAGTTAATTLNVRAGGSLAGITTVNGHSSGRKLGGVMASRITITEILP